MSRFSCWLNTYFTHSYRVNPTITLLPESSLVAPSRDFIPVLQRQLPTQLLSTVADGSIVGDDIHPWNPWPKR